MRRFIFVAVALFVLSPIILVCISTARAIPVSDEHLGNVHTPNADKVRNEARDRASGTICQGICGAAGAAAGAGVGRVYGPVAGAAAGGTVGAVCGKKCK